MSTRLQRDGVSSEVIGLHCLLPPRKFSDSEETDPDSCGLLKLFCVMLNTRFVKQTNETISLLS